MFNFVSFYFVFYLTLPLFVELFFPCLVFSLFLLQGFVFQWDRVFFLSRLNLNPMGEGQYDQHVAGGNPRAYMTMRDYRNLAWQNQQPLGRNPNPNRSMRDYRNQWMSAPVYSVPSTYAPPVSPHFTSTPQPPQPP